MVSNGSFSPPTTATLYKWANVIPHFQRLRNHHLPFQADLDDANQKALNVANTLYREFYSTVTPISNDRFLVVGSVGKQVARDPLNDVDILFQLPDSDYHRYHAYSDNGQSALLQDVKETVLESYPNTDIRGDGQVVVVDFNSIKVEIVPVFYINGTIITPNTHHGGSWNTCNPHLEAKQIQVADQISGGKATDLIRLLKAWKDYCNVPIKSIVLERAALVFASNWQYRINNMFWYDWMVRDFFDFLLTCSDNLFQLPGSQDMIFSGSNWISKCLTARDHAHKACFYEEHAPYFPLQAKNEWEKIFGPF